jgi:DNA-directed RNA polymerase sigma subunit (sigma70/sigma32)
MSRIWLGLLKALIMYLNEVNAVNKEKDTLITIAAQLNISRERVRQYVMGQRTR